jgi:hypothetical protein
MVSVMVTVRIRVRTGLGPRARIANWVRARNPISLLVRKKTQLAMNGYHGYTG